MVSGNAQVSGDANISMKMIVTKNTDLIVVSGIRFVTSISLTGINVGCKHYVDFKDFESRYLKEGKKNSYSNLELSYLKASIENSLKLLKGA